MLQMYKFMYRDHKERWLHHGSNTARKLSKLV